MLSEYIGIIGAVAGSVSTLIVVESIRHIGGVKFFLRDIRFKYRLNSSFSNSLYEEVKQPFRLGYDLDIYNCGSIPRLAHDFSLAFYKGGSLVLKANPKCDKNAFNVNPRELVSVSQVFDMDDLDNTLVGITKIVLSYKTSKRRNRKFVLYHGNPLYPDTGKKA
ncbi:hypothetical protein CLNEO_17270 [Anaerotignum neopropionicum]|uniref:Uncharacterized protein n=1 Tax=Anaerotignum neopropionicum TaxID=36847 RepID=A0A136WDX3_9FIRM|nr:hypothetical protein [Anaerotignum neopropionicum]KXL52706.1 hypothetical protein CLNEO_17270 [Anaerotignum neopropionicum]